MCLFKSCWGWFGYTENDSECQEESNEGGVRVEIKCLSSGEKWISEGAQSNKVVSVQFNNKPQLWNLKRGINDEEWCLSVVVENRELYVACDEKSKALKFVEEGRCFFSAYLRPEGGIYFQDPVTKMCLTRSEKQQGLEFTRAPLKGYLWEITQQDGSAVVPDTATIGISQEVDEEKDATEPKKRLKEEQCEVIIRAMGGSESWGGRRARRLDPILVRKYKREQKWNLVKQGNIWTFSIQRSPEEGPDLFLSQRDQDLVFQSDSADEQREFKATLVGDAIFFSTVNTVKKDLIRFVTVKNRFLTLSDPREATKWEVVNAETNENIYPSLFE